MHGQRDKADVQKGRVNVLCVENIPAASGLQVAKTVKRQTGLL